MRLFLTDPYQGKAGGATIENQQDEIEETLDVEDFQTFPDEECFSLFTCPISILKTIFIFYCKYSTKYGIKIWSLVVCFTAPALHPETQCNAIVLSKANR